MDTVAALLLKCVTIRYPSTKLSKYSNCTVTLSKHLEENQEIWFHITVSTVRLLLLSGLDAIITTHVLMHNPDHTRIFCKPSHTCLTQIQRNLEDPDNLDDLTQFQPWCALL